MLIKKPNDILWMCMDFTDLNKACLKDSYPLPKIDKLIDTMTGYNMLTFMDTF